MYCKYSKLGGHMPVLAHPWLRHWPGLVWWLFASQLLLGVGVASIEAYDDMSSGGLDIWVTDISWTALFHLIDCLVKSEVGDCIVINKFRILVLPMKLDVNKYTLISDLYSFLVNPQLK